jgi:hypothetical protein
MNMIGSVVISFVERGQNLTKGVRAVEVEVEKTGDGKNGWKGKCLHLVLNAVDRTAFFSAYTVHCWASLF